MTASLVEHTGTWVGSNAFRLMPDDDAYHADSTAVVSTAAGGSLTVITYTWVHLEEGAQDGLLVLGPGSEVNEVTSFWGDSWHQTPEPALLTGTGTKGALTVGFDYGGGWRWQIRVEAGDPDVLRLIMNNIVPPSAATDTLPAGSYCAMATTLRRAG